MPLLKYTCQECCREYELFDDESHVCKQCKHELVLVLEGGVGTAATTNLYQNRHIFYDSFESRHKWNVEDMRRREKEKEAENFQKGLQKL